MPATRHNASSSLSGGRSVHAWCALTLAVATGCSGTGDKAALVSDTFARVSMEEGSKCTSSRPCWKRIVVTAAGATRIEEHDATTEGRALAPRDLARVKELADSPRFRDLLGASAPTCPSVFDYQVIFEVETASMGRLRDVHASGCLGDEYKDRPDHPYRRLKSLMDELAQQAFARP